jgi:hypothetical protein
VIVYDGDCAMCTTAARFLVRRGVPAEDVRPFSSFEGALAERLVAAGIRNEIAVLDPASDRIRSGAEGLFFALAGTRLRWATRIFDRRPLRGLASGLYRLVSFNRRVLSPVPPRAVPCACEPDDRPGLRWTLVAMLYASTALVAAGFGATFLPEIGRAGEPGPALAMVAVAAAGQALAALLAAAVPAGRRGAYVAHLAATAAAGSLLLLPAILLGALARGHVVRAVFSVSGAAAFLLMLGMQRRRVRVLGLTRGFVAGWIAALATGTASAWVLLVG